MKISQKSEETHRHWALPQPDFPLRQFDERGDFVFRFGIGSEQSGRDVTLEGYCRETLIDLLRIVRLYSKGRPVIVEEFSFANDPSRKIPLDDQGRADHS